MILFAVQLEKVLLIWQRKAIISDTLLQPAILQARTQRAQHDAAWGDADALSGGEAVASAAGAASGQRGTARAAATRPASGLPEARKPMSLSGPDGRATMWRIWRRLPMNAVVLFKFIDQKVNAGGE